VSHIRLYDLYFGVAFATLFLSIIDKSLNLAGFEVGTPFAIYKNYITCKRGKIPFVCTLDNG